MPIGLGKKTGIILASIGLIFMLVSTTIYGFTRYLLTLPSSGGFLTPLLAIIPVILLLLGLGAFGLSSLFYLAAYLASRRERPAAIGGLFTAGGVLALIDFLILISIPLQYGFSLSGPPHQLAISITLILIHAVIGSSLIIAGTKAVKTK